MEDASLFMFKEDNKVREMCTKIVHYSFFENFIILIIVISSVLLALENPLYDPKGLQVQILEAINTVFSIIFVIEAIMKIISFGLIFNGDKSYLQVAGN